MSHLTYAFQEMAYRLHRVVAVILTIALAVGLILTVNILTDAYLRALRVPFQNLGSDMMIQRSIGTSAPQAKTQGVFLPDYAQPLSAQDLAMVKNTAGVGDMAGSIFFWSADQGALRVVLGMTPASDFGPGAINRYVMAGRALEPGESGKALVDEHYAAFYQVTVGTSKVEVGGKSFDIIGIVRPPVAGSVSATAIFIPLADAQQLLNLPGGTVNTVHVRLAPGGSAAAVQSDVQAKLPGVNIQSAEANADRAGDLGAYATKFGWALLALVKLATVALVYRTFASAVQERAKEIAVLRTIGWTLANIRRQFVLEAFIQALAGALLGLGLGAMSVPLFQGLRVEDRQAAQWISGISGGDGFHGHVPSVKLQFEWPTFEATVLVGWVVLLAVLAAVLVTRRMAAVKPGQLLSQHGS